MTAAAELAGRGWCLTTAAVLGWPSGAEVIEVLAPALEPDPRAPHKLHARDVIEYDRSTGRVAEAGSVAHVDGTDDFSRFRLLDAPLRVRMLAAGPLILVPLGLRRCTGRLSADYFRYSPGPGTGAHQDQFGDLVIIWVLDRHGEGAESYLLTLDGRPVLQAPLPAGSVLAFRDEMFLHGVTPLLSGSRDALIFITLKDPP